MIVLRNIAVFECIAEGWSAGADDASAERRGRVIVDVLSREAAGALIAVAEPVTALAGSGWAFTLERERERIWCTLQRSDAWVLITAPRRTLLDRQHGRPSRAAHAAVCAALDAVLRFMPDVRGLCWLTQAEYRERCSGAARPARRLRALH